MSYILEALKKLEQKRRREELPHLLSAQNPVSTPAKKRPLWPYMLFLAMLLNAGLFLWWLRPWHPVRASVDAQVNIPAEKKEESRPVVPPSVAAAGNDMSPAEENNHDHVARVRAGKVTARSVAPEAPRRMAGPDNRTGRPVQMNDLPLAVRQSLPDLTISGHFFGGDASARIVTIGGRTLHEGQTLAPGLKLERITQDGVVLSYEGQRFIKGLF